jgi:hypothetical protein
MAMAPDSVPTLRAFVQAAQQGAPVRAWQGADGIVLGAVAPPGAGIEIPVLPLFKAALSAKFGADAAYAAARELDRSLAAGALPATAILQAVGTAESLCTIGDARDQVRRMQFSAALLGQRFVVLCESLGVDPKAIPAERRQAIDDAVGWHAGLTSAEASERLQRLLRNFPLH